MYKVDYQEKGLPHTKQFDTLYQVSEWIHNLHWWGRKPTQINIRWEA